MTSKPKRGDKDDKSPHKIVVLVVVGLWVIGCSDLVGPDSALMPVPSLAKDTWTWHAENVIGPEGGTLTTNLTKLTVPPGALSAPLRLTLDVTAYAPVGLGGAINRTYEFGSHGTVFRKPVTLILSFRDADLGGLRPEDLSVWYYREETETWEDMGGEVDVVGSKVMLCGDLPHFSRYALAPR